VHDLPADHRHEDLRRRHLVDGAVQAATSTRRCLRNPLATGHRCHGADALVAIDRLVDPDPELRKLFQPTTDVARFDVPNLEVLDERIGSALDEAPPV
jgi:hypothetical protein